MTMTTAAALRRNDRIKIWGTTARLTRHPVVLTGAKQLGYVTLHLELPDQTRGSATVPASRVYTKFLGVEVRVERRQ